MSSMKSLFNTFILAVSVLAVASCVPKATENKAVCGKNQAFDNVSRSCYSIEETRRVPVGTASNVNMSEEIPATITLSYTDANLDQVKSCNVSSVSSNIEVISPWITGGGLFTGGGDATNSAALSLASAIPAGPYFAAAVAARAALVAAYPKAKTSFSHATILAQMVIVKAQINVILGLAANFPVDAIIQSLYTTTQTRLASLNPKLVDIANYCACTGGICTTVIVPKLNKFGAAGLSYTVTDVDGPSAPKAVSISIAAMSPSSIHLKPVAQSSYMDPAIAIPASTYDESIVLSSKSYPVTIAGADDIAGTTAAVMEYYFSGTIMSGQGITVKGKVQDCMDLAGSTGLTDKTCTYIPNNRDANDTTVPVKASVNPNAGDLIFTAVSEGLVGNNFTVQYFDLTADNTAADLYVTSLEKFGLVNTIYNESFIRVAGNAIKIFINPALTNSTDIQNLVNSHLQAKHLVKVTGATGTFPVLPTPAPVALSGGVDGFDTIPFTAKNPSTSSVNSASAMLRIVPRNDPPLIPRLYTVPLTQTIGTIAVPFLEGATLPVSFDFSDVDSLAGFTVDVRLDTLLACKTGSEAARSIDFLLQTPLPVAYAPGSYFYGTAGAMSCTAGVCSLPYSLTTTNDFQGTACLYYTVTDSAGALSFVQSVNIVVTGINDTPLLSSTNTLPAVATALPAATINEDLFPTPTFPNFMNFYVNPGGGSFEAAQILTVTATSSNPTLIPNTACPTGYATGAGAPSTTPGTTGAYYMDTTNFTCYKSAGTSTSSDWKLYPSLTLIKTSSSNYKVAYVPTPDQSGNTNITIKVQDNGGVVNSVPGADAVTNIFNLVVNSINDPPVFLSTITSVETNEGGAVQSKAFQVDEDAASTLDEDQNGTTIASVVTDNGSVLPPSAIRIFYDLNDNGVEDSGEFRAVGAQVEAAKADDVKAHKIYLKLDPVDGVSGNANVQIRIADVDDPTLTATMNFAFIVHPVAALHGGWTNIASVGLKTDKSGTPVSSTDIVCDYNRLTDTKKCSGGTAACIGSTSPNGIIIPDAANTIFWDSANLRCYRSTGATEFTWVEHNTSCPITRARTAPTTLTTALTAVDTTTITVASTTGFLVSGVITIDSEQISYTSKTATAFFGITRGVNITTAATHAAGSSIIVNRNDGLPFVKKWIADATPVTTAPNQYYYIEEDKSCHQSYYNGAGALVWDNVPYQPSKVTLSWKPYIMVGSGSDSGVQIAGWNVYRRMVGTDYNFNGGHLKDTTSTTTFTVADPTLRTFTDITAVAGKVYYYTVRPVDSIRKFPTFTPETFSEVRVLASPANYSFVHRWIVNQEICNGMNITNTTTPYAIDQTNNFRCPFVGPGSTGGYYDYGRDLLVDTQEVGCPYAVAPKCSANGCVGIGVPTATSGIAADDLYYDRGAGVCYRNNGGGLVGSWVAMDSAVVSNALSDLLRSALNAPLVNIKESTAASICSVRRAPAGTQLIGQFAAFPVTRFSNLPNKKDYIAYSSQKLNITDPEITELEQGFSLNIQSRCNGSSASGLDTAFTDSSIPSTSFIYSLPGTYSSGIRSLYTGSIPWGSSKGTGECVSRFGIQDLYGNVAEWTQDQVVCNAGGATWNTCTAVTTASNPGSSFVTNDTAGETYAFNSRTGPHNDINADKLVNAGDGFLTNWAFADELFGAGKFSYPLALPVDDEVSATFTGSSFLNFVLDIGPSNGITINKLHEDGVIINNSTLASSTASFAVGGSYLSGNRTGRFSSELIKTTLLRPDVGMRCLVPINKTDYPADANHTYPY
ncbi:MAG: hypothetical protein H7336_08420 [Bacteriovorax sp.]|nr:hypothetical protein [Bacteriovorax sp.]